SSTAGTLTYGLNDGSTSGFSGTFARFNDSVASNLTVTKLGPGTTYFTGSGTSTGTLNIDQGTMYYAGTANTTFATHNVWTNLTLDNSGTNFNNRLGGANLAA